MKDKVIRWFGRMFLGVAAGIGVAYLSRRLGASEFVCGGFYGMTYVWVQEGLK